MTPRNQSIIFLPLEGSFKIFWMTPGNKRIRVSFVSRRNFAAFGGRGSLLGSCQIINWDKGAYCTVHAIQETWVHACALGIERCHGLCVSCDLSEQSYPHHLKLLMDGWCFPFVQDFSGFHLWRIFFWNCGDGKSFEGSGVTVELWTLFNSIRHLSIFNPHNSNKTWRTFSVFQCKKTPSFKLMQNPEISVGKEGQIRIKWGWLCLQKDTVACHAMTAPVNCKAACMSVCLREGRTQS